MQLAMLVTHIRAEEKQLIEAFRARGVEPDIILDRDLNFDLTAGTAQPAPIGVAWRDYDLVFERCVSTSRGLYALALLSSWGVHTINRYDTARVCADKLLTTLALAQADVPQPAARAAFAPDSALGAVAMLGYPVVLKPVMGSWGRLLARVNDRESAEALIEHRQTLGDYQHHIYYAQQYIDKTRANGGGVGRDIRAFVIGGQTICAIYRESQHWITNTARGGRASNCPVTPQLADLCARAARAVGGGVLAIDVMEGADDELLVNEINHTMEFRNSSLPTGVDIAAEIVVYALELARSEEVEVLA
jgi:[lysine-biosynthesis-protein LysW]--L-2-aminoadipate ligase